MLERAGFVPRRFEIRTVTTVFRDVAQIIAFLQATTCSDLVPACQLSRLCCVRRHAGGAVRRRVTDCVSSDGIRLERYVFARRADKPRGRRYFFALTTSDSGVLALGALVPSPL